MSMFTIPVSPIVAAAGIERESILINIYNTNLRFYSSIQYTDLTYSTLKNFKPRLSDH
jgi:hypothetical protein